MSRMAPSSSALAWPTADGSAAGGARPRWPRRRFAVCAPEKISASAESSSHEIVNSRASAPADGHDPARLDRKRSGSRKSSPACRFPMCCWRSIRRVRHRGRRGRRPLPAHAGSDSPSARETPDWHRAAGRADRSGCRREEDRAGLCRAGFRRAPAAPGAISHAGSSPGFGAVDVVRRCRRFGEGCGGLGCDRRGRRAVLVVEPCRQLPGESR